MPKNIDRFNAMAGLLLAHLYGTFPHRVSIDERGFVSTDGIEPGWWDTYHGSRQLYVSTALWLRDAGYIWIETEHEMHGIFDGCVLSPKGLEALKAVPPALSGKSFGDSLITAAKSGALDTVKGIAGEVVTQSYKVMIGLASAQL